MNKNSVIKFDMGNLTIKIVMHSFLPEKNSLGSPMHNHVAFEFHTVLRGELLIRTDKETACLNENDSCLIPPEIFHETKYLNDNCTILSFTFFLERNNRKKATDYLTLMNAHLKNQPDLLLFSQNLQMVDSLKKAVSHLYSTNLTSRDSTKAHFMLFLTELFAVLETARTQKNHVLTDVTEDDARLFMIEEYFNEYYMETITLKHLSALLHLSEKQTDRMIKKAFGEGFCTHLTKIRLQVAKTLLKDTKKEIQKIAAEVGYQSYNGFYLAFKKNLKTTPEAYRKAKNTQK